MGKGKPRFQGWNQGHQGHCLAEHRLHQGGKAGFLPAAGREEGKIIIQIHVFTTTVTSFALLIVNFWFQPGVSFSLSTPWAPPQLRSVIAKVEA